MQTDLNAAPFWILVVLAACFVVAFGVVLYFGISGKRDVKLWLLEIKNAGLSLSASPKEELNKLNGAWEIKAVDMEIPSHQFTIKYSYEADVKLETKKTEVTLSGYLTYRNIVNNEKMFNTKIEGHGYITDGQCSITYVTYAELYKQRITTGLGAIYAIFSLNGNSAKGYFLTSDQSSTSLGIGTVAMSKKF